MVKLTLPGPIAHATLGTGHVHWPVMDRFVHPPVELSKLAWLVMEQVVEFAGQTVPRMTFALDEAAHAAFANVTGAKPAVQFDGHDIDPVPVTVSGVGTLPAGLLIATPLEATQIVKFVGSVKSVSMPGPDAIVNGKLASGKAAVEAVPTTGVKSPLARSGHTFDDSVPATRQLTTPAGMDGGKAADATVQAATPPRFVAPLVNFTNALEYEVDHWRGMMTPVVMETSVPPT